MKSRYRYRFYPTDEQAQSLARLFGCVRVVWNDALAFSKAKKFPGYNSLSKLLTLSKKTEDRQWLNDVCASALQQSLRQLGVAYKNYFDSLKGKRRGRKVGYPRFKKRTNQQSATFVGNGFKLEGASVYLSKIGNFKPIWARDLPSKPSSVTVIKDCANRYFLSFVVEAEPVQLLAKNQSIGVDLGLKAFAFMSNGEQAHSPDYSVLDRKIRRKQRQLERQISGSKRREVTRLQIARLHNRIADKRKDFLHKLSTQLAKENQVIVLEDLNVSGALKNRRLSRVISLQGWAMFRHLCKAKASKYKREFVVISRWEPTSQVCSDCGYRWGKLELKVRTVQCLGCGSIHDRDENAAKNIEKVGIGNGHDFKWAVREGQTGSPAHPSDPSRITGALAQ